MGLRGNRKLVWTAAIFAVVGSFGFVAYQRLAMPVVSPHRGDGDFKDISWRWPWGTVGIPVPGYTIAFPTFNLQEEYGAEFRIQGLPDLGGNPCVYLCIHDPEHRLRGETTRKRLTATIRITVQDENGKCVCQVDEPLAQMHWAEPEGGSNCYGLYALPDSRFASHKGGQYVLRVQYMPDSQLSDFQGFVYIRCGGSI